MSNVETRCIDNKRVCSSRYSVQNKCKSQGHTTNVKLNYLKGFPQNLDQTYCQKYRWEIIPNFVDSIIGQLFHPMCIVMYCWFHVFQSLIPIKELLYEWYMSFSCYSAFLRDLILCCKLYCSNYGGYLHIDMTSQISIPMSINSELSCLHGQLGSALVQICHGRARYASNH